MEKMFKNKRYIFDPLYGIIYLPSFIWDVIPSSELQRLREVRLCNINSFCLTGGANINRYEHAIGTFYLAQECLKSWPPLNPISKEEEKHFLLAALLHDVTSAAFGHSVEYIERKEGFDHEKAFAYVVTGEKGGSYRYKSNPYEHIFFGMYRDLSSKIHEEDLKKIGEIITGKGRFGPLISSIMDLDNIDNVFRLAYHIGIINSGEIPLKLAKSIWIEHGKLVLSKDAVELAEKWHEVRKKLYEILLLNPEEFSAKCMLTEAIELAKEKDDYPFNWYDVDYELLKKLSYISDKTNTIILRINKGDLYGCIGIFSTKKTDKYGEIFIDINKRRKLEEKLSNMIRSKFSSYLFKSAMVALHSIIDKNKTERQICIRIEDGSDIKIGTSSNQLLIGVFFKNVDLNMYAINNISDNVMNNLRQEVSLCLSEILNDQNIKEVELYSEATECRFVSRFAKIKGDIKKHKLEFFPN